MYSLMLFFGETGALVKIIQWNPSPRPKMIHGAFLTSSSIRCSIIGIGCMKILFVVIQVAIVNHQPPTPPPTSLQWIPFRHPLTLNLLRKSSTDCGLF